MDKGGLSGSNQYQEHQKGPALLLNYEKKFWLADVKFFSEETINTKLEWQARLKTQFLVKIF